MKNLLFMLFGIMLFGCGGSPADTPSTFPDSNSGVLSSIELGGAKTLALASEEPSTSPALRSASLECKKLGKLRGAIYSELGTQSTGGDIAPCFSDVAFWKSGAIYGQYRPADSTMDIWFVTDAEGNVFHLPEPPRKGHGFKNDKLVRTFEGNPIYLGQDGSLKSLNLEDAEEEEETILRGAYKRFEILDRPDGEHLIYVDWDGAGKRMKPDDSIENINEIESTGFFVANSSQDLLYKEINGELKTVIFDASGGIIDSARSSRAASWEDFKNNPAAGKTPPTEIVIAHSIDNCEKDDDLMMCGGRGFLLADSSRDMQEINWCDFGHCAQYKTAGCLSGDFIYFYSKGTVTDNLSKISRDLSGDETILQNFEVEEIACGDDGGLLIRGHNIDTGADENFHLKDNTKTFLTKKISKIIR